MRLLLIFCLVILSCKTMRSGDSSILGATEQNFCPEHNAQDVLALDRFELGQAKLDESLYGDDKSKAAAILGKFNQEMEPSVLKAANWVLAEHAAGRAKIYLGSYSRTREESKDGGEGMRTVLMAEKDGFLASVIFFWRYDQLNSSFELAGPRDVMRARVELDSQVTEYGFKRRNFAGLSYEIVEAGLAPGAYLNTDGSLAKDVHYQMIPSNCVGCHSSGPIKGFYEEGTEHHGVQAFYQANGGATAMLQSAVERLLAPETYDGIRTQISQRCQTVYRK